MAGYTPQRIPGESSRAYAAFCHWVVLVPKPDYKELARQVGSTVKTIHRWSCDHSWKDRAGLADRERLETQLANRDADREKARQRLVDAVDEAVEVLLAMAQGDMTADGAQTPLLNRHGEVVGERPVVTPAMRLQAAKEILDRAGMIVPKRMELSGPDGTEIKIRARTALSDLSGQQLAALATAFGVDK